MYLQNPSVQQNLPSASAPQNLIQRTRDISVISWARKVLDFCEQRADLP